jgi:hypothetical protein
MQKLVSVFALRLLLAVFCVPLVSAAGCHVHTSSSRHDNGLRRGHHKQAKKNPGKKKGHKKGHKRGQKSAKKPNKSNKNNKGNARSGSKPSKKSSSAKSRR